MKKIMLNFNWVLISSDNKLEIIYIFSLLNSKANRFIFNTFLKSENEKDILIGIKTIKEFVQRVPKITDDNQFIKNEIIGRTKEVLALEDVKLSDLVDFSGVMTQKLDDIKIEGNDFILEKDGKEIKCKIKNNAELVKETIKNTHSDKKLFKDKIISLADLKNLPAIDFKKQKKIKDYIDDLVFSLYFNVPIRQVGIEKAGVIKKECEKSKFYKILNKK